MNRDGSFDGVMVGLREGEEEAARQIFDRFACRLIALARSRLDSGVRQKVDPEDLVQSAYKSFFVRFADGQFELQNWDSLWAILTVITLRKCGHEIEYYRAACRDFTRETRPTVAPDGSESSWHAIDREPTPSEAAMLTETVEILMRKLDERERRVLMLSLQGFEVQEISHQIGRTERTVRRTLEKVRTLLEQMRDTGE
jgi:RNA polymerase sigma-70 factor (ECF subfamily)